MITLRISEFCKRLGQATLSNFELSFCVIAYTGYMAGWFGFRETLFAVLFMIAILASRTAEDAG